MNDLLRKLVIAWDADQSEEFNEALGEARTLLGLTLAPDAESVLEDLQLQHLDAEESEEAEPARKEETR